MSAGNSWTAYLFPPSLRLLLPATIRGSNTKPELRVRSHLHALGFKFRLHRKDLPGRPDVVLPKYRMAIFVHGCFWHCHDCRWGIVVPKTRSEFWAEKRHGTTERDVRNIATLQKLGWKVLVIWECQTHSDEELRGILASGLC